MKRSHFSPDWHVVELSFHWNCSLLMNPEGMPLREFELFPFPCWDPGCLCLPGAGFNFHSVSLVWPGKSSSVRYWWRRSILSRCLNCMPQVRMHMSYACWDSMNQGLGGQVVLSMCHMQGFGQVLYDYTNYKTTLPIQHQCQVFHSWHWCTTAKKWIFWEEKETSDTLCLFSVFRSILFCDIFRFLIQQKVESLEHICLCQSIVAINTLSHALRSEAFQHVTQRMT